MLLEYGGVQTHSNIGTQNEIIT